MKRQIWEGQWHREYKRNVCGLIADSYIRQALVYSAHPSCSPSVFLHTLPLNILLWKNPLRRYRPLLLSVLKIRCQDHLYNPLPSVLAFLLALATPRLLLSLLLIVVSLLNTSSLTYLTFLCAVISFCPFLLFFLLPHTFLCGPLSDRHPSIHAPSQPLWVQLLVSKLSRQLNSQDT